MKRLLCAGFLLTLLAPKSATAAPISAYGGTLEATLRLWDFQHDATYETIVPLLRHEYELGADFMAAVPLSFQQSLTPYSACADTRLAAAFGPCLVWVEPIVVPGTDPVTGRMNEDPTQLGALIDGCAPGFGQLAGDISVAMIARGNCAFSTKWENAEAAGYPGVLVENNVPGAPGGIASVAGTFEPTVPFFLISQDVADEIRTGSRGYLFDGTRDNISLYYPLVSMSVRWTPPSIGEPPVEPPVETVPEPSSMLLSFIGAGGVALARRRPTSRASSSTRAARCDASSARSRCR
jgi:hypothetical protein